MLNDSHDRVRDSRLAADLDALRTFLRRRGHRPHSLAGYMHGAAHLAACIDRGGSRRRVTIGSSPATSLR